MERYPGKQILDVITSEQKAEMVTNELEKKMNLIRTAEFRLEQLKTELKQADKELSMVSQKKQYSQSQSQSREIHELAAVNGNQDLQKHEIVSQNETTAGKKESDKVLLSYDHLKNELGQKLAAMKQEVERIRSLKKIFSDGHRNQNEELIHNTELIYNGELEEELGTIILSIDSHIHGVLQVVDAQNLELAELYYDHVQISHKSRQVEKELGLIQIKPDEEIEFLRQKLRDFKKSLREQQHINESLKLQTKSNHVAFESESCEKAERANEKLTAMVVVLQTKMQEERKYFDKVLHSYGKRLTEVKQKLHDAECKNNENINLHQELTQLQEERKSFEKILHSLEKRLTEVKQKLHDAECKNDENLNLHQELIQLQNANIHLEDQLLTVRQELQHQKQNLVDQEALRKRLDEVSRGIKSSQSEQEKHPSKTCGCKYLVSQTDASLASETSTDNIAAILESSSAENRASTFSSPSSSNSSSLWSMKKQEIYNSMNFDEKALFDELQWQIKELRALLAVKDKGTIYMLKNFEGPQFQEVLGKLSDAHSEMESLKNRPAVESQSHDLQFGQATVHEDFSQEKSTLLYQPSWSFFQSPISEPQTYLASYLADDITANSQYLAAESHLQLGAYNGFQESSSNLACYDVYHMKSVRTAHKQTVKPATISAPIQRSTSSYESALMPSAGIANNGLNEQFIVSPNSQSKNPLVVLATNDAGFLQADNYKVTNEINGRNEIANLYCNVPEHHDLEDCIGKLQQKIAALKDYNRK